MSYMSGVLEVSPRSGWVSAGEPVSGPAANLGVVSGLVVHYPGGAVVEPVDMPARLRAEHHDYLVRRRYSLGYNWVIDGGGRVWEVRGFDIQCAANGTNSWNRRALAVQFVVSNGAAASDAQVWAFQQLRASIETRLGRPVRVYGHREVRNREWPAVYTAAPWPTECPGEGIWGQMQTGVLDNPVATPAPAPAVPALAPPVVSAMRLHTKGALAVDYATGSRFDPNNLARRGVQLIMRYLPGGGGSWKHVTGAEMARIHQAGIGFLGHFEAGASDALGGEPVGRAHGRAASLGAQSVGIPPIFPITFAIDFGATQTQIEQAVIPYMRGVAETCWHPVWVYGSANVVDACMFTGVAKGAVQTVAWSHGRVSAHANILQRSTITSSGLVGLSGLDECVVLKPSVSWLPGVSAPLPPPTPAPPYNPLAPWEDTMFRIDYQPNTPDWVQLVSTGTAIRHVSQFTYAGVLNRVQADRPPVVVSRDELLAILDSCRLDGTHPCPAPWREDPEIVWRWVAMGGTAE